MTNREAGKGSDQRPTNHGAYSKHYEKIFGKKPPIRDHIGALPIEVCRELFGTKDDAKAEDEEFERIEREQRDKPCQKENP